MNGRDSSLLRLTGLWLRRSAKGNEYLTGRIGAAKVIILENRDRGGDSDPSHVMYLAEASPRPAMTEQPGRAPRARKSYRNAYEHLHPTRTKPNGSEAPPFDFNDPLPDNL